MYAIRAGFYGRRLVITEKDHLSTRLTHFGVYFCILHVEHHGLLEFIVIIDLSAGVNVEATAVNTLRAFPPRARSLFCYLLLSQDRKM